MPWVGRKKIAFVPLSRPNAHPPDVIPADWENDILQRALYHPDPTTGLDRSLRAFVRAASSGVADVDAVVTERHSVDQQDVLPAFLEPEIGARLRAEGCDAAAIVMLGGAGAGMNSGFWSRFVMEESTGVWAMELMHGLTGFADLYPFGNDVDPQHPVIGRYDEMSGQSLTHPTAYTKAGIEWLDPATVAIHPAGSSGAYALHAISLPQPPPTGRVAAVRVGTDATYVMIEARLMADQFDAGIPEEGVIVYAIQTPHPRGHRVGYLRPVILMASPLSVGEFFDSEALTVRVTAAIPGGFVVDVFDRRTPLASGQLLSYADAGTPGNVANPMVVGNGGWLAFSQLFAGRNAAGEDRIYAVDQGGRLLSYADAGTPGNVANPMVVALGRWQGFTQAFAGRNAAGEDGIYAIDRTGVLYSYRDTGTPGNVVDPVVVDPGGWDALAHPFAGRNAAGEDRIYAVVT